MGRNYTGQIFLNNATITSQLFEVKHYLANITPPEVKRLDLEHNDAILDQLEQPSLRWVTYLIHLKYRKTLSI